MGVVRREGKWTLEKVREGLYEINERGELRAEIITDDYTEQGGLLGGGASLNPMVRTIEVRDFSEAERKFKEYVEEQESGGFGMF